MWGSVSKIRKKKMLTFILYKKEKVYFTPQPIGVGTHHPQPMKMDFFTP
jgi:hypothetical protein